MRKFLLFIILQFGYLYSFSCDICGCGVGNYYLGVLPEYKKRFVGLRYQYKTMITHLGVGGTYSYLTTNETHKITELWGAYNFGSKFRVIVFLPFNEINRNSSGLNENKSGFGDIAVQGHYNILNKKKSFSHSLLVHSLWLGAGIKLPTGKYDNTSFDSQSGQQNSFQLGSGSTDLSLHLVYDIRLSDAGINASMNYRNNGVNSNGYKFGNKISSSLIGYYKFLIRENIHLSIQAGVIEESTSKDSKTSSGTIFATGGNLGLLATGAELTWKKVSIGHNFQSPISQSLANGQINARNRVMFYFNYSF